MDELMKYLFTPIAQIGLICGIAEIFKMFGVDKKWIPIIDIVFGILSGLCVYTGAQKYTITEGVVLGIALGLSACGLFSGIKNTIRKEEKKDDD